MLSLYETDLSFNARCWMLGAGALGRPRGMVWGGRREEGSGWGTHVYLWWIHLKLIKKKKIRKKKEKKKLTFQLLEWNG